MVEEHHKKDEHHEKKDLSIKLNNWQVISIVLALLLIFSIFTGGFKIGFGKNNVAKDVEAYLNNYLLAGQGVTATVKDITSDKGMYKLTLDVGGRTFDSYVTKDGSLLFPSAVDLTQTPQIPTQAQEQPAEIPKSENPDVKLFIMSYCPFGIKAIQAMAPVTQLLKDLIKVSYVIYPNYQGGSPEYCIENGKYCSMHGIQELNEDVRQMCIQKYQRDKFWGYVLAVSDKCNYKDVDSCWEEVAKSNKVDVSKVKSCFTNEKVSLLQSQLDLDQENGVSGSPTLVINGAQYNGDRTPTAFKEAICSAFTEEPKECSQEIKTSSEIIPSATSAECST
ncbi:thioredoxin domain-containing protein [Candidatus Woesearchaeota archaeon]|nr:thioredoxin domain-containing protein [Candidatus Woesearchaeota archaeon]